MRRFVGSLLTLVGLLALAACDLNATPVSPTPVPAPAASATPVAAGPAQPSAAPVAPAPSNPPASTATEASAAPVTAIVPTLPATAGPTATAGTAPAAYFVYARPDGSLWRADGAGRAPIPIARATEPEVLLPWAASPDGRTIAYVSGTGVWGNSPPGAQATLALWMVQADGSGRHKIQNLLPPRALDTNGGDDDMLQALTAMQELAWSPDGSRVAFVSGQDDSVDLYTATPDGKVARLTQSEAMKKSPRWSPDGRYLACMTTSSFSGGGAWNDAGVLVVGADGSILQDRANLNLASGDPATFVADLVWVGADTVVAGLEAVDQGGVEFDQLAVGSGAWTPILSVAQGDEAGLWWSAPDNTLALAVTPGNGEGTPPPAAAGLYVWKPGAARATQISGATIGPIGQSPQQTMDPVGPVAWRPQGGQLAYNIQDNGAPLGVHLWTPGSQGSGGSLTSVAVQDVLWEPDGQRLAADGAIYRADGQKVGSLPGANALLGWGPQGIFFTTPGSDNPDDETSKLWVGTESGAQQLDSGLDSSVWGRLVVPRP